ncbi:MAG: hypothetical protein ACFCAD_04445, partial [Pleurocapsa sp.]
NLRRILAQTSYRYISVVVITYYEIIAVLFFNFYEVSNKFEPIFYEVLLFYFSFKITEVLSRSIAVV